MALKITADCINCDICKPACPNQAITAGADIYAIDAAKCTECVGHFDEPQCIPLCPVDCIVKDPKNKESREQLLEKYRRLMALAA